MNPTPNPDGSDEASVGIDWMEVVMAATLSRPDQPGEHDLLKEAIGRLSQRVFRHGKQSSLPVRTNSNTNSTHLQSPLLPVHDVSQVAHDWTRVLMYAAMSVSQEPDQRMRFTQAVQRSCRILFAPGNITTPTASGLVPSAGTSNGGAHIPTQAQTSQLPGINQFGMDSASSAVDAASMDTAIASFAAQVEQSVASVAQVEQPVMFIAQNGDQRRETQQSGTVATSIASSMTQTEAPATSTPPRVAQKEAALYHGQETHKTDPPMSMLGLSPTVGQALGASAYFDFAGAYPPASPDKNTASTVATSTVGFDGLSTPGTGRTGMWPSDSGYPQIPDSIFDGMDFGFPLFTEASPAQHSASTLSTLSANNCGAHQDPNSFAGRSIQTRTVLASLQDSQQPSNQFSRTPESYPVSAPDPVGRDTSMTCPPQAAAAIEGNLSKSPPSSPSKTKSTINQRRTQSKPSVHTPRVHIRRTSQSTGSSVANSVKDPALMSPQPLPEPASDNNGPSESPSKVRKPLFVQTPRSNLPRTESRPSASVCGADLMVDMFLRKHALKEVVTASQICRIMGYSVGKNGDERDKKLDEYMMRNRRVLFQKVFKRHLNRSLLMLLDASRFVHLGVRREEVEIDNVWVWRTVIFLPDVKCPYYTEQQEPLGWDNGKVAFSESNSGENAVQMRNG
ncbi:hypothetical protein A4X13_0g5753 [Tilletia indica]|uniref:Uncharacterized protein n=1 Tax=Tilletia indica TaxID=43049 RepID=A0A177TB31_9BASI|nr:hypothetical protein A4X13_0g5753 [Tilletia indica]